MNNTLLNFSPATTLLILKGPQATMAELLKLTFFDLVHRNILEVTEEEIVNRKPSKPELVVFVKLGPAGKTYAPTTHENLFLQFFNEHPGAKMLFQTLVKLARRNAVSHRKLYRNIIRQPTAATQFRESWYHWIFGDFSLSDQGIATREALQREIAQVKHNIQQSQSIDPQAVGSMVQTLGAYLLLIPGIDLAAYQLSKHEFGKTFADLDKQMPSKVDAGGGCSTGDSWSSMSATFDNGGCGGHGHHGGHDGGHDGGHGCGGDIGGGGDSGCGGGGCGGGGCGGGCGGCGS
jgi:hypothetical protein